MASETLILLAGGASSRMGEPKGLLRYRGRTWLEEQLDRATAAGVQEVTLVLGHQAEFYLNAVGELEAARDLRVVVNPDPGLGSFSSLQCGLGTTSRDADIFVCPIDVPLAGQEVWKRLCGALTTPVQVALPIYSDRGGHPVLLHRHFWRELLELDPRSPKSRLDVLIRGLPEGSVARVPVGDPSVRVNFNTPQEWQAYTQLTTSAGPR